MTYPMAVVVLGVFALAGYLVGLFLEYSHKNEELAQASRIEHETSSLRREVIAVSTDVVKLTNRVIALENVRTFEKASGGKGEWKPFAP